MSLSGYIDRDRRNNDYMNDFNNTSQGWSYLKKEKLKEVTPKKEKENLIIAMYSHEILVPQSVLFIYEKELHKCFYFLEKISVKELKQYYYSMGNKKFDWVKELNTYCQNVWDVLKQIFEIEEIYQFERDIERMLGLYLGTQKSKKYRSLYNYFLYRISGILELTKEEHLLIQKMNDIQDCYKKYIQKSNHLIKELEQAQMKLQVYELIRDNKIELDYELIASAEKIILNIQEQISLLNEKIIHLEEEEGAIKAKYDNVAEILIYGHR